MLKRETYSSIGLRHEYHLLVGEPEVLQARDQRRQIGFDIGQPGARQHSASDCGVHLAGHRGQRSILCQTQTRLRTRPGIAVHQQITFALLESTHRRIGADSENAVYLAGWKTPFGQRPLQGRDVFTLHQVAIKDKS